MPMILEVKNLTVSTRTRSIVKDISFELHAGETLALVGESGSGKSTIAHSIMRLTSEQLTLRGQILFENQDLLLLKDHEFRKFRGKQMGMIFQNPATALNPTMPVGEQISESLYWHEKLPREIIQKKCLELLRLVGIPDPAERMHHYPHQFSGGQKQRLIIAIALACNPRVLIADEPTSSLDLTVQAQILGLLQEIQQKSGIAILFITHDLHIVASLCRRVLILKDGEIVEAGNVESVFAAPTHPYTQALLEAGYAYSPR